MKSLIDTLPRDLTAKEILGIPSDAPELLFKPDADAIRRRYRELSAVWHPNANQHDLTQAHNVFEHIAELKDTAEEKLKHGIWETPGEIQFVQVGTGKPSTLKYVKKRRFELGEMYISKNFVTFAVEKQYGDLFENAQRAIKGLTYANDGMRAEFERYVPTIQSIIETANRHVMVVKKDPHHVLLSDLQEHWGGKIDPKHTAWVLSRMHNLACFLEFNGLAHNGISPDTVFVSMAPKEEASAHSAALLGGWWYAAKADRPLIGLPQLTVEVVPPSLLSSGRADTRVDLMLIRSVGRILLGDKLGMTLARDKTVPQPMADWLTLPPTDNARTDYTNWYDKILPNSFGARRFVEMKKTFGDIYQPT